MMYYTQSSCIEGATGFAGRRKSPPPARLPLASPNRRQALVQLLGSVH